MKKQALFLTGLTFIILLSETELSSDLLLFFLVGAVPGTTYSIPSGIMLTFYGITGAVIILHLLQAYGIYTLFAKQAAKAHQLLKQTLDKRPLGEA